MLAQAGDDAKPYHAMMLNAFEVLTKAARLNEQQPAASLPAQSPTRKELSGFSWL